MSSLVPCTFELQSRQLIPLRSKRDDESESEGGGSDDSEPGLGEGILPLYLLSTYLMSTRIVSKTNLGRSTQRTSLLGGAGRVVSV